MPELKPGARMRSVTCTTEVVVVRGAGEVDLRCGGQPMIGVSDPGASSGAPASGFDEGTQIGKRYGDEGAGVEVLCTKAGAGSISIGEVLLLMQGAKPLPSSD
jgi:hypothetical protein